MMYSMVGRCHKYFFKKTRIYNKCIVIEKLNKVKPIQCPDKDNFLNIQTNIIAKLDDAKLACKSYGEKLGYRAFLNEKFIEGDVKKLANYFTAKKR